ncbi:MAG: selenide, water dikinase SelD, partial [Clostridia bacterium]|nr:selenide, water dikinase SelD [Clostridia bacterium]
ADKVLEAGAVVVGGHTVEDPEPKYGLAVTGIVHPDELMTNARAQPGEVLILTKPLGSGIISTAIKAGMAGPEAVQTATAAMAALNRAAAEVALKLGVRSCTDVTGFGLLGHAAEMALASGVGLRFWLEAIPVYPQALELAAMGLVPGGAYANRSFLADRVSFAGDVNEAEQDLLFDPQTSGGLLFTVPAGREEECLNRLRERGVLAAVVGEVVAEPAGRIEVVRVRRS